MFAEPHGDLYGWLFIWDSIPTAYFAGCTGRRKILFLDIPMFFCFFWYGLRVSAVLFAVESGRLYEKVKENSVYFSWWGNMEFPDDVDADSYASCMGVFETVCQR